MFLLHGIDIEPTLNPLGFRYGPGCFGPTPEYRRLDDIRRSLMDPRCNGPDIVYAIAMDVGKIIHRTELEKRMLLFGVVTYAGGRLGCEPIRSQGHIHKISAHSGWSPPEIYEIWQGKAIVYMQEYADDCPGRCFAVYAEEGDVVVVPPGWAHATISADPKQMLTFGAWCDREYGFEYEKVRAHGGLAWYPLYTEEDKLTWSANPKYAASMLEKKRPRQYRELNILPKIPIYSQFEQDFERFQFVSQPGILSDVWKQFTP